MYEEWLNITGISGQTSRSRLQSLLLARKPAQRYELTVARWRARRIFHAHSNWTIADGCIMVWCPQI